MSTVPPIALDFLVTATGGTVRRSAAATFQGVTIDGRNVPRGGLWFAIRGEHHDGHRFASQAVANGALGLVVERGRAGEITIRDERVSIVEVDDPVAALGRLARAHREALSSLRVVGVTGSNGKTTTKELCAGILGAAVGPAAVHKTEGNYNNHLGLPLTLLKLHAGHRYAVIEMGMSGRGEIAYLAGLARPEVGIIVNVGPVHLEQLGSIDEVARAKGELFAALSCADTAVYPDGDARIAAQAAASRAARHLRFGTRPGVAMRVVSSSTSPSGTDVSLRLPDGARVRARLAAIGAHNAFNAAAAAAAAWALGIDADAIARGLGAAGVAKHRSTVIDLGGRHVLDDCYNASPLSTAAALDALAHLRASAAPTSAAGPPRAVALLGDMLELGPQSALLHRSMGEHAARLGVDRLVAIGPHAEDVVAGARDAGMSSEQAWSVPDVAALCDEVERITAPGDWVLVKASRGMQLERVIQWLRERFATSAREQAREEERIAALQHQIEAD